MTVRQLDRLGRNGLGGALVATLLVVSPQPPVSAEQRVDVASEIWQGDLSRRLATADRLADSALFEQLYAALEAGPRYARQVPTGRVLQSHRIDGVEHPYLVLVPRGYDPERRYPARIYLHGGVARRELPANGGWWRDPDRLASEDHIAVFPASWADSTWWQESQLASLAGILARLKMTYNLDENRVHVVGRSDGGTGAWYLAFRNPTPWAGFVPMIGHPAVLASPRVAAAGQMHPVNLRNRAFLVFNGETDRLYPAASVRPYIDLFREAEVAVEFVEMTGEGHTVSWWPQQADRIERFVASTTRDPLPTRLSWETEDVEGFNRAHWLVIDEVGAAAGDAELPDIERRLPGASNLFVGFPRFAPSGRVEATVVGNEIELRSRGVRRLRLLLSPRQFDLARPLRVTVNGVQRHFGVVPADSRSLLRWAARDLDRSMLFAAELEILIPALSGSDRPSSSPRLR